MELQKIIEQLKNKPTCSTSTQTAHTETAATIGTQTSLTEARYISTQTECNEGNSIMMNTGSMDINIKNKTKINFAPKSTQCNLKKLSDKGKLKHVKKFNRFPVKRKNNKILSEVDRPTSSSTMNNFNVEIVNNNKPSVGQNELVECSIEYEPNLEELAEENPEADRTPLVTTKEATASIDSTIDGIYLTTPLQETPKSKLLIIGDEYSNGFSRVMEKVTAPDNRIHLANNPIGNTVLKNVKITDKPDTHPKVAMLDSFLEIQPTPTLVV
ncbi:hypothetical protein JTB14_028572 [Gonioctena quinquepunctata]|nr:hypothetical protein JTB14_028572 [Gonioctena quinquepunctata]